MNSCLSKLLAEHFVNGALEVFFLTFNLFLNFFIYCTLIIQGDFIVIIPYMCAVYFEHVKPSITFPFSYPCPSSPIFQVVFGGFH
jgi:hypothetical protein